MARTKLVARNNYDQRKGQIKEQIREGQTLKDH